MALFTPLPEETVQDHIDYFLKTPNTIYVGHVASACVLLYIAAKNPDLPLWYLVIWGLAQIICYPALMELWRRLYLRCEPKNQDNYYWITLMDALCFSAGFSWGGMLFVGLEGGNPVHFAIQLSIAAGASAAAVRSIAAFPRSYDFYAIPFLGLLALRLLMMGPDYGLLGTLVLVFLFMMLSNGRDMRASVAQYIAMRNENLDLAKRYQAAAMDAENANREKTRLLAAASHDLRQPIHAIGLYMETLSLETMEPKARQTLVRIRSSLQTLSRLFNSLLDVSLLDSGKIQVKDGTFDLQDMLNHILDDYEPLAEIANVTLMMECERVGIFGDSILIRRMVQNLLSNAIRHSAGGSVRVCVQQDKGQVSISVIDEGPGIAKEYESFIFEEFTQITSRSTRLQHHEKNATMTEKGLGLGLAIVRRLADLQSLTLKMETSPAGTSMTISGLKAAELIETTPEQHSPSARAESAFAQKTILVVDDDPETLEATTDLLRNWGCTVVSAASLEEIVWQTQKPDLVISDYSFGPDYTGIEIVARLRQAFGADLKALIISGDSTEEVEMRIKQADLLLIRKPVQPVQLRSAMLQAFLADREPQTTVAE